MLDLPARLDRRVLAPGSVHRFAAIRLALAVVIAGRVVLGPYARLADSPPAVFDPPTILSWLSAMPGLPVLVAAQVIGLVGAAMVVARGSRAGFALVWASLLFLAGLRTSVGKIMHNDVLLLVSSLPIIFGPVAAKLFDRRRTIAVAWPVRAAALLMALVYFWAGVQKLRFSGIGWVFGDNMRWTVYQATRTPLPKTDAVSFFIGDRPWLAKGLAGGALGLELTSPLLLVHRWGRALFVIGAVCLHTSIYATLGLDYWGWALTVAIVLAPWDRWGAARQAEPPSAAAEGPADPARVP